MHKNELLPIECNNNTYGFPYIQEAIVCTYANTVKFGTTQPLFSLAPALPLTPARKAVNVYAAAFMIKAPLNNAAALRVSPVTL